MSRDLDPSELSLWQRVARTVRGFGQAPVSPVQGNVTVAAARTYQDSFDPQLDLHGLKIQEAFHATREHIDRAHRAGYKKLVIITGRSGQMNVELPRWIDQDHRIRSIKSMNGGGAWEVCLKREKPGT